MNKQRLRLVVRKLRSLPRGRFNYGHWVGDDWKGAADLSCGTTACALGWATTIPSLRRAGLRLAQTHDPDLRGVTVVGRVIEHSTHGSLRAASKIFDISYDEADYLFIPSDYGQPDAYASAKQVALHIERFIERGGIPKRHAQ